jgi:hypothetical protein
MITLFQALNWMTTTTLLPLFLLFIYSFLYFGLPSCSPCAHRARKESERLSKLAQTGRNHSDICNNFVYGTEGESGGWGAGTKIISADVNDTCVWQQIWHCSMAAFHVSVFPNKKGNFDWNLRPFCCFKERLVINLYVDIHRISWFRKPCAWTFCVIC